MTSPSLPPALANLAGTIISLQNRIAQLERNQRTAQLATTSIEGGTLVANDPSGNATVAIGLQSDGTVTTSTVASYLPPQTPDTPQALAGVLSVWVVWDGLMAGGAAPFLDFQAVQVHCSAQQNFTPTTATLAGTMHSAGLFTVGQLTGGTTYYVALVAVNDAGVTGTPSPQASAVAGTVAQNITAGTITASLLASGIVVAGIVDATTITGAQIIADGTAGQFLIYNGPPGSGNLAGAWSGAAYTDPEGNIVPAGLTASQANLSGASLIDPAITGGTLTGGTLTGATISAPVVSGGAISEAMVTFDPTGGQLLAYTGTPTTVTLTTGVSWTAPAGAYTSGKIECWGGCAGGDGGTTTSGGPGAGGGAYSCEPNYPLVPGTVYSTGLGAAGTGGLTGQDGTDGGQASFDGGGVVAYAGLAALPGSTTGGLGGQANPGQTISYPGGNGGSVTAGAASAGGGGRAGASGPGGNGGNAAGSPGAAGTAGAGTGGLAGGAGVAAATTGHPGGGGSGAGQGGAGTTYQTLYYDATGTSSYYGDGSQRNGNGSLFQGKPAGNVGVTDGDQTSFAGYNYTQIRADWAGWTIDQVTITVANQGSWYASGCYAILGFYTSPGSDNLDAVQFWCNQGTATGPVDITGVFGPIIASTFQGLIFGPSSSTSGGSGDLWNYGYFQGGTGTGSPRITVKGHQGSGGSYQGGNGVPGVIKITYTSSTVLESAISPVAGTDATSNAYAAGYTGPVSVFQPGSSPAVVETWHAMTLVNGWTATGGGNVTPKYRLVGSPPNSVEIIGDINHSSATSATFYTLPAGYRPVSQQQVACGMTGASSWGNNTPYIQVDTSGNLSGQGEPASTVNMLFHTFISLDA